MPKTFTTRQICEAAQVTRSSLAKWISDGVLTPTNTPEPGLDRQFTERDAFQIAVFAELVRLGIPMRHASMHTAHLTLRNFPAALAVWQGEVQLLMTSEPGKPVSKERQRKAAYFYDPASPPFNHEIVKIADLPDLVADPHKRAVAIVNLDMIEARLKRILGFGE